MVLGKLFRIYHKTDKNNVYSVLFENKNDKSQTILFESGAVGVLSSQEIDKVKHLYNLLCDVYGCLGVLNVSLNDGQSYLYLVCVTGCVSVGKIQNSEVFCITETTFISLHASQSDLDKVQDVRKILNANTFYFSWSSTVEGRFDLTLCCQKSERTKTTDNRFFWNRMLHLHLQSFNVNTEKWLLKVMCGGVSINTVYVGHQQAKACLISRLSCERAGTRFNVRGTNDNGHVANFVETEQVIFLDEKAASFILIRGSIPLFWEQTGVQVGTHRLKMSRGCEISQPAFDRHLALIQYLYGRQVLINLVGNKESEHLIGSMYKAHHKSSRFRDDIPYIAFDYHHFCPRGREENLVTILKEKIKNYFDEFSFFYSTGETNKNYQSGTFRINCIDCLDRTNRVQTFIGLEILMRQLKVLNLDEKPTIVTRFFEIYKNMWHVNGDQISRIYAGTGALEGKSKFKDGTLSVARTIQNNLLDNSKQEAIDILLTGKPLVSEFGEKFRSLLPPQYLHLPSKILVPICDRHFEYTTLLKTKIAVGTWNVNGGKHFNSIMYKKTDPLSDWLLDANKSNTKNSINILDLSLDSSLSDLHKDSPDLFAIGFEEIVDLNAQNIVATSTTSQKEWLVELEKTLSCYEVYVLVTAVQLVGVCLFLFTKPKFARFIRDVSTDQVKTGLGGAAGNKGGVGIRIRFYNTTICFVCSHFAAGQNQTSERNSDYREIVKRMFNTIGKNLYMHDYVFWCGDFNYRIDLPSDEVKQLIKDKNLPKLLEFDQLKNSQKEGKTFRHFKEGKINFDPTYKYDINSDDYDTSEKSRIPAWTDRVLYRKFQPTRAEEKQNNQLNYGEIVFYGRAELKSSDHRPVIGEYRVEVLKVDTDKQAQVFRNVIESVGPSDATVTIRELSSATSNIFEEVYVREIMKKLKETIGPIVLARFGDDHLKITFKDGTMALKLAQTGSFEVLDKTFSVSLMTPEWKELIEEEVNYGMSNTVPMLESCEKFEIDDLNDYDVSEIRPDSPTTAAAVEEALFTETVLPLPTRPPPPRSINTLSNEHSSVAPVSKPVRPAPPPPKAQNSSSVFKNDIGFSSKTTNDESFNQPPPSLPAPTLPKRLNSNYSNSLDYSDDDNEQASDDEEEEGLPPPQFLPDLPPPNFPSVSAPSLPPPIPSRRPPPAIPPRNN